MVVFRVVEIQGRIRKQDGPLLLVRGRGATTAMLSARTVCQGKALAH